MTSQSESSSKVAPRSGERGAAELDASTPLTLREAAILAGVDEAGLSQLCDDGTLLFETRKRGRKSVRVVRLRDLAEVYPDVLGRRHERTAEDEPVSEAVVDVARAVESDASVAEAVRASGTSRDALIELCQDLETRLDLADRERQASTASLLMAQRRVLDLELHARPKPWARASGTLIGLLSMGAIVLAVRLPGTLRDVSQEQAEQTRAALAADLDGVRAEIEGVATRGAATREAFADRIESSEAAIVGGQRVFEDLARQARGEREASSEERARLESTLDGLTQRLAAAEDEARRRAVELELLVNASSRERARFAERLSASERVADDARAQLAAERRSSAEERVAFERSLEDHSRVVERSDEHQADELRRLRDEIKAALQPVSRPAAAARGATRSEAPDSWMSRALRVLTGATGESPGEGEIDGT